MNRTALFLSAAAVLALVALVAGLPRGSDRPTTSAPVSTTTSIPAPNPAQDGSLSLAARLSHPYVPAGRSDLFVTADVRGQELPGQARSAINLCLVIDRSGSMSGFKLDQAKQAARQLVSQLTPADRLAVVHYGSDVESMAGVLATPENKTLLLRYIDGIWDNGGTNIGQGLTVARGLVERVRAGFAVNRLVLISDGQPTEGLLDAAGLVQIVREIKASGISVSSIGVGNDFNEQLMEAFAEVGGGAYAYLQDAAQLSSIFQKDLNAAGTQVARGVTLTFHVPRGATFQEALGYRTVSRTDSGTGESVTIALPDFAAGQTERVVARLSVEASQVGRSVDVSALGLEYFDLLHTRGVRTDAALRAMVTDSPEVVAKSRDKDAIVFAARAQSAVNTQAAAEAIKHGDRAGAEKLLDQNAVYFGLAADVAGAPAVKDDLRRQELLYDGLKGATTPERVNAYGKEARKQARKDFGLMGSTY